IAGLMGMDVPDIQLLDTASISNLPEGIGELRGQAIAIKRFDRSEEGPVHMEDFAQVFGIFPDNKYRKASYRSIAWV
ncbi:HipA domain-containing protein, partial [Salmonella enterica]|uniref:HipA domain-containing protein n=1 Tax=Salmonella enterica TaxID=28901 RepID=UPI003CE69972